MLLRNSFHHIMLVVWFLITASAAADEYSAEIVQQQHGKTTTARLFVKGLKQRMDMQVAGQEQSFIMDQSKDRSTILMHDQKAYLDVPKIARVASLAQNQKELDKLGQRVIIGTEIINGIKCNKYRFIYHDENLGRMTMWNSQSNNRNVKLIHQHPATGKMITEVKNFKEVKLNNSLFEIPADYRKIDPYDPESLSGESGK
jgi:hypothetical protein